MKSNPLLIQRRGETFVTRKITLALAEIKNALNKPILINGKEKLCGVIEYISIFDRKIEMCRRTIYLFSQGSHRHMR